jgi:hypothetical protein
MGGGITEISQIPQSGPHGINDLAHAPLPAPWVSAARQGTLKAHDPSP